MRTGHHLCMVVEDDDAYRQVAAAFLAEGGDRGEKTVIFGPDGSRVRAELGRLSTITADPHRMLDRGPLDPSRMYAIFRRQAALAHREGFTGLRVAADMDWLLPAGPTADQVVGFEANLDRVVSEIGASVLCAYRSVSFDSATVDGTLCVHPAHVGHRADPPFTLVAGDSGGWRLSGAVDVGAVQAFTAALRATAGDPWVVDASRLEFVDVAGMRAIAGVARAAGAALHLRDAGPSLRRHWQLAGFAEAAPGVRFTG